MDFDDCTRMIIGRCIEVHKHLGPGWEEKFYQRALAKELGNQDFQREVWVDVNYRGQRIGRKRMDFIIDDVILETKAKKELEPQDYIQTLSYLKATGYKTGLLINFGSKRVEIKRFVN